MPEIVENRRRELQQQLQQQQQSSSSSSSGTSIKHETKASSQKSSNATAAAPGGASSHLSSGNDKDISPGRHSTNLSPQSGNAANIDRSHVDTSSTMTTPNGGANYGNAFVARSRRTSSLSLRSHRSLELVINESIAPLFPPSSIVTCQYASIVGSRQLLSNVQRQRECLVQ